MSRSLSKRLKRGLRLAEQLQPWEALAVEASIRVRLNRLGVPPLDPAESEVQSIEEKIAHASASIRKFSAGGNNKVEDVLHGGDLVPQIERSHAGQL